MKITGIELRAYSIPFEPPYKGGDRSVGPLDIYDEYADNVRKPYVRGPGSYKDGVMTGAFLAVMTDEGLEGLHGPIVYRSQLLTAVDGLAHHLVGRDPMDTRFLWDIMSRFDRHSRSGIGLMAISTVDIALWDLKGKILGQPVYKVLGGGREKIRPYISTLGFSTELGQAREKALEIKASGIRAQKWFFKYGPRDGMEGLRKNLDLAFELRDAVGDDYELMFDCWLGWTVQYAKAAFRELESVHPMWVEEVLRPHMMDGYIKLKEETSIPLSAGEHLYTRMEVNPYLQKGVFDVMQSDPEWCGGITEALRIADLCELYGVTFIPHGHALMPALQVVASAPPDICPYCEVLAHSIAGKTAFFKERSIDADGFIRLNDEPGLGETMDAMRLVGAERIRRFDF
jgi:L-alanine-DL-glutamate epimerase-like enolase superfamily enzyme